MNIDSTTCKPTLISWNLTRACNLQCAHCYIDAARAAAPAPGELTAAEGKRILDQIGAFSPGAMVILTGGEPLLRADLEELVEAAAGAGTMPVLGTNGLNLTADRARRLAQAGLAGVGISVDSLLPARHDRFRGLAGAWDGAVRGFEAARAAGMEAQFQVTLTPDNASELPGIVEFARARGAWSLNAFFLVCTGRGQGIVDLSPGAYETLLGTLLEFQKNCIGFLVRPRCVPTFRRKIAQSDPRSILLASDIGRCLAARSYCRITPEGDVTPCPYLPLTAGSLREHSFGEIWDESPLFRSLRAPALQGKCGTCAYRELCGGCRARAYARNGDVLGEDPWCVHEPRGEPLFAREGVDLPWAPDAEARLAHVPPFVRDMVRRTIERHARSRGATRVSVELMAEVRPPRGLGFGPRRPAVEE